MTTQQDVPTALPEDNGSTIAGRRGAAPFRAQARLIRLLGEELISDESMALLELVKNAYDADARRVTIAFRDLTAADGGSIEIRDNGHGMDLDTVLGVWLEPATRFKRGGQEKERTARGRFPLGEKGVGRFAADKLGTDLELVTRAGAMRTKSCCVWAGTASRQTRISIRSRTTGNCGTADVPGAAPRDGDPCTGFAGTVGRNAPRTRARQPSRLISPAVGYRISRSGSCVRIFPGYRAWCATRYWRGHRTLCRHGSIARGRCTLPI